MPQPEHNKHVHEHAEAVERELKYIGLRRRHSHGQAASVEPAPRSTGHVKDELIGLALSGGGIRSATTNLGILQALSRMQILPLVDYVCTVSGGGYIGACLSSLLSLPRPGRLTDEPYFSTDWESFPFNPNHREGRAQIDHLRTHGSFLVTHKGLLARETMRSIGLLISGTLYHVSTGLLALLIVAWLYMAVILGVSPDLHATLSNVTPTQYMQPDPAYDAAKPEASERSIYRYPTLIESLTHKALLIRDAGLEAATTPYGQRAVAATAVYGIALSLLAFAYLAGRQWRQRHARASARARPSPGESQRDARERAHLRHAGFGGLFAAAVAFAVSWWFCSFYSGVLWLFVPATCMLMARLTTFGLHLALPRFSYVWNRSMRSLWGAFQAMASYAFWTALLLALFPLATYSIREQWQYVGLSGLLSLGIARLATLRGRPANGHSPITAELRRWLLGVSIGAGVLLILVAVTARLVPPQADANVLEVSHRLFVFAGVGAAVFFLLGWIVDANRVSPHYFYQDRLGETYLFTEKRDSGGSMSTARNSMRLPLASLHGREVQPGDATRSGTAPYHLISAAINLAASRDLTRKDRKSGYFVFSKYFCGSSQTGFCKTEDYQGGQTRLARAMTISGAAASSGIGAGTFFAQAFATVLFNLRLGYWMPNPRSQASLKKGDRWYFWPRWLAREMFMRTDEHATLVNLSDGGHTGDNVGIYPLLQRRCRVIIACDAERDSDLTFGSITEALRHAYIDLGIDVDIDFTMIRPDPETGMSRSHCAVGLIRYPPLSRFVRQEELPEMAKGDSGEKPLIGYLIYLKNSLTGDEPEPVLNYKAGHPAFPHETTADQFFDDAQFESYRALGAHIAEHVLAPWVVGDTFQRFRERHWPFPPAPSDPRGKHAG